MDLAKENDQALVAVVFMLTGIVFVLDLLTPSEIAVWTLYLVPLGLTRWSLDDEHWRWLYRPHDLCSSL